MATAPAAATDPYRILQVSPNADLEAIHAAYRRLARRYHPDLNPQPEAAERMRAINAAYGVLSDPARRAVNGTGDHSSCGPAGPGVALDVGMLVQVILVQEFVRQVQRDAALPGPDRQVAELLQSSDTTPVFFISAKTCG